MALDLIAAFDATDADETCARHRHGRGTRVLRWSNLGGGGQTFDFDMRKISTGARDQRIYPDSGGRICLRIFDSLKPYRLVNASPPLWR